MTTITIANPHIAQKYSSQELQIKFLEFLKKEMGENTVNLYEMKVEELSPSSQEKFKKREDLEYVEY